MVSLKRRRFVQAARLFDGWAETWQCGGSDFVRRPRWPGCRYRGWWQCDTQAEHEGLSASDSSGVAG